MPFSSLSRFSLVVAFAAAAWTVGACNMGGLNDAIKAPGDDTGGVKIALGDIAVSPDGDYVLFERDNELAVGWVDSGEVETLPVTNPARLAFSKQRRVAYVTTEQGQLTAVNIDSHHVLWTIPTGIAHDPMVVSSADDERVAVGSGLSVVLYDTDYGNLVADHQLDNALIDLEILPDDERLLAVEDEHWVGDTQTTTVRVVALADGAEHSFEVPNCSDDIIVPKHGQIALLAPTSCSKDPISYIDLTPGEEKFVRNLPGFGPVALGPDGVTAVGFLNMQQVDESLFDDPADVPESSPQYHLMVIDTETLEYAFHPYGDTLPRYALTPDGNVLLVDTALHENARLFDVALGEYRTIDGPAIGYEQLSFSSDSSHAYVLSDPVLHTSTNEPQPWVDYKLFDLDVSAAKVNALDAPFRPRNVNISPDDKTLFLRSDTASICIYSLATQSCERELLLAAAAQ